MGGRDVELVTADFPCGEFAQAFFTIRCIAALGQIIAAFANRVVSIGSDKRAAAFSGSMLK
jgi:hypothetical protein